MSRLKSSCRQAIRPLMRYPILFGTIVTCGVYTWGFIAGRGGLSGSPTTIMSPQLSWSAPFYPNPFWLKMSWWCTCLHNELVFFTRLLYGAIGAFPLSLRSVWIGGRVLGAASKLAVAAHVPEWRLILGLILPHGVIEIPVSLLSGGLSLSLSLTVYRSIRSKRTLHLLVSQFKRALSLALMLWPLVAASALMEHSSLHTRWERLTAVSLGLSWPGEVQQKSGSPMENIQSTIPYDLGSVSLRIPRGYVEIGEPHPFVGTWVKRSTRRFVLISPGAIGLQDPLVVLSSSRRRNWGTNSRIQGVAAPVQAETHKLNFTGLACGLN